MFLWRIGQSLTEKSQVEHSANSKRLTPETINKNIPLQTSDEQHVESFNFIWIIAKEIALDFPARRSILQKFEVVSSRVSIGGVRMVSEEVSSLKLDKLLHIEAQVTHELDLGYSLFMVGDVNKISAESCISSGPRQLRTV